MKLHQQLLAVGLLIFAHNIGYSQKQLTLPERVNAENVFLVDVRSAAEYAEGSANGAINIPIDSLSQKLHLFKGKENIVLFCKRGIRAEKAKEILAKNNIKAINGTTVGHIKSLQKINALQKISYRTDKQTSTVLKRTETIRQVLVALGKKAIIKKHTTDLPTQLIVLKGQIKFLINQEEILLTPYDVYDIPVDVEHEVIGLEEENLFMLTKVKDK